MQAASKRPRLATHESAISPPSGTAQLLSGLRPEQMAFLGEYAGAAQGKQVFVQLLCWPTVPAACRRTG